MTLKKAPSASGSKKPAGSPHVTHRDMIKEGILTLKDRTGSSRQALKKYIQANYASSIGPPATFDSQFNKALRTGVEKGDFTQPKGPSGPVKLAKKDAGAKAPTTTPSTTTTKPAPKKTAAPKKATTKSAASKTSTKSKTPAAKKSAPAAKKTAAPAKAKANTSAKRKAKAQTSVRKPGHTFPSPADANQAPAIVEVQQILGKTKSGRVTKTNATQSAPKKAAPKKAAPKKATPAKKATPKQSSTHAAA